MITSLHPHHITYTPHTIPLAAASTPSGSPLIQATGEETLHFDYAIYALGSHLPLPIDLWGSRDSDHPSEAQEPDQKRNPQSTDRTRPYKGTKQEGMSWLRSRQRRIEAARKVLVVGGGALGIRELFPLL